MKFLFYFPVTLYYTTERRSHGNKKRFYTFVGDRRDFYFWRSRYVFGRRRFARVLRQHCVCGRPAVRGRRQKPERSQCVALATDFCVPPPHGRPHARDYTFMLPLLLLLF